MTIKDIEKTIQDALKMKHRITVRDISYVVLFLEYNNSSSLSYKSIFDKDASDDAIKEYDSSKKIVFLKKYITSNYRKKEKKPNYVENEINDSTNDELIQDITFEENKAKLIAMLQKVNELVEKGDMSAKDGVKAEIEIRSKLNDKFKVSEEGGQQYIIVEKKFNFICPHLHKECYVYTKEDLMEEYGLIEKDK